LTNDYLGGIGVKIINKATGAQLWTGATDDQGWYYGSFAATGKQTTYTIIADTNGTSGFQAGDAFKDITLGGPVKYAQWDFLGDWAGGA
jgi:hypothetical protein